MNGQPMSAALFNQPSERHLSGVPVLVYKVEMRLFGAALDVATWSQQFDWAVGPAQLEQLRAGAVRDALAELVAGCIAVRPEGEPLFDQVQRLTVADVQSMPIVTVAEAFALILEVNMDFFTQTLPRLAKVGRAMGSTGSALLSSLSVLGTTPTA